MYNASKKPYTTTILSCLRLRFSLKQACGLFLYISYLACFYYLLSKSYNFVVLVPFKMPYEIYIVYTSVSMKYYIFYVVPRRVRRNLFMPSFRQSFAHAKL
jgi:hypothetical protein